MSATDARLPVGSVLLRVASEHASARLAVDALMTGFRPDAHAPPPGRVIKVDIGTTAECGDDLPVHGTMRSLGRGDYLDESQPWAVRVEGLGGPGPVVHAAMRPVVDGPELWFQGVRKLLRSVASMAVVADDAVLVHGCAMAPPDGPSGVSPAVLFLGASGAGKTTMTRRLPGWTSLADDAVLLRAAPGMAPTVAGTPFPGRESLPRDGAPRQLARVAVLAPHAADARLEPIGQDVAFRALLERVFCLVDGGPILTGVLDIAARVAEAVPAARLHSDLGHDIEALLGGVRAQGRAA